MRGAAGFLSLALLLAPLSCAGTQERIVETAVGRRASERQVDEDNWGLFPAGALLWAEVDVRALMGTEFGGAFLERSRALAPVSRASEGDWIKGIEKARVAVYASARGDVATVLSGRFDRRAMTEAVRKDPVTSSGEPIVIAKFAGCEILQGGAWSLAFLTERTVAVGTEIGVRRILERVEEGRVARALPDWFEKMLKTSGSALFVGVDLDAQPVPATLRTELDFLDGLRGARVIGNFAAPGLNLAGTLTYDTKERAEFALGRLESSVGSLERATWLLSILRVPRPIKRFEAAAAAESVKFGAELEGRALAMGVSYLGELEGKIGFQ